MKYLLAFIFGIISLNSFAQKGQEIQGRVLNNGQHLENVHLRNITSGQYTLSNEEGLFSVKASHGDTLLFSHVGFLDFIEILDRSEMERGELSIRMIERTNELREVELSSRSEINAVSLGIVPEATERLSTNERRLETAGDFKWTHLLRLLVGSLQIDPILNAINGKTKKLKRNILIEKKLQNIAVLEGYKEYMAEEMKLSEEDQGRLINFVVEEKDVQLVIDSNNDRRVEFFLLDTWFKFQNSE